MIKKIGGKRKMTKEYNGKRYYHIIKYKELNVFVPLSEQKIKWHLSKKEIKEAFEQFESKVQKS